MAVFPLHSFGSGWLQTAESPRAAGRRPLTWLGLALHGNGDAVRLVCELESVKNNIHTYYVTSMHMSWCGPRPRAVINHEKVRKILMHSTFRHDCTLKTFDRLSVAFAVLCKWRSMPKGSIRKCCQKSGRVSSQYVLIT